MENSMNIEIVKLFNVTIGKANTALFAEINNKAIQCGYFVMPDACNEDVRDFINFQSININSTFYKKWSDVVSKNRFELFIDQILHYSTTYGTDFSHGNGYVPNDGVIDITPEEFSTYTIINAATVRDVFDKCVSMVTSGIALKQSTLNVVVDFITQHCNDTDCFLNIDSVNNREAQVMLCDKLGIVPSEKFNLFRYIIYKTTGSSLIINNKAMFRQIMLSPVPFDFNRLTENDLCKLASIYRRYKTLFCAFKHNPKVNNSYAINKLNRLAKKYHTPFETGLWENVTNVWHNVDELKNRINEVSTFKLVRLINSITEYKNTVINGSSRLFIIRNGKVFNKNESTKMPDTFMLNYKIQLEELLKNELIKRLSEKKCLVRYPESYELACPTSEKNFIGNIPFGTSFAMSTDNVVGIYWKNEWGTRDFDLHYISVDGKRISWNTDYYAKTNDEHTVIYSGDMTNANPEATELMYIKGDSPNALINVNRYNGEDGSKYILFFGNEHIDNLERNYMVNPASIKLKVECESASTQQLLGIVYNNKYIAMSLGNGNNIVSYGGEYVNEIVEALGVKAESYTKLKDILSAAGFVDVSTVEEYNEEDVLDFTSLSRDTLISLFS